MRRANSHLNQRVKSGERGAVLVEMAFVLPIIALIFLSIIDLGLIVREFQLLQNAAREAARVSILPRFQIFSSPTDMCATSGAIKQVAVDYLAQEKIGITASNVTVNQVLGYPADCQSEITINYTRPVFLLGAPFLSVGSVNLTGRSVFQNLYGCYSTTCDPSKTCGGGATCP